jgi:hypothetical protein
MWDRCQDPLVITFPFPPTHISRIVEEHAKGGESRQNTKTRYWWLHLNIEEEMTEGRVREIRAQRY